MSLVNKGEKVEVAEEEIGQRILTAIKEVGSNRKQISYLFYLVWALTNNM